MMLYVYIINIFIYSGTRSVLGSVPVRFGYFGYKNIGTVRIFEGIGPVPVSGISVRFRFGSSVPVILPGLDSTIKFWDLRDGVRTLISFTI